MSAPANATMNPMAHDEDVATDPGAIARVNHDLLYRSPDGREAWVVYDLRHELAFIVTDIHGTGAPANAVGFTAAILRQIADELDAATAARAQHTP